MNDCIFCKIISGDIPSYTIYEDDVVKAFLDISQTTPGHSLVIPKKHVPNIYEYDADFASQVFARIPKIARAIRKFNPDIKGMNIVNNNGEIAYQSVFHSHFHLIPRYSDQDGFKMQFSNNENQYNDDKYQTIAHAIKEQMED